MNELVYVATPFSDPDPIIRQNRYLDTYWFIREQTRKYPSNLYYSPIYYYYRIAQSIGARDDADFWWGHNKLMLDAASRMLVVKMAGWEKSKGVKAEIEYMTKLKKPIKYVELLNGVST